MKFRTLAVVLIVHIAVHLVLIMLGPIRAVRRELLPEDA